ncbi:MAG TPA: divalent-cation tolerance protein CutA [Thermoflexia bacterium]|jgi:periplasmic divalent cation tolerance protein|nr:divalent-cation tolerance protein CutA [Thermoflexia bacterium]
MTRHLQVVTTVDTEEKAQEIARALVERRLVACAQVLGPITSTYWWQGQVESAQEWLCILKTRSDLYEELERTLTSLHPYEVPEILATPVAAGNPAYLAWLDETLKR